MKKLFLILALFGVTKTRAQDIAVSVEAAREKFTGGQARQMFDRVAVIERLRRVPTDTEPFVAHLKEHGRAPKDFVLDAQADPRGNLFIVGSLHAYKSAVQGTYSTPRGMTPVPVGFALADDFVREIRRRMEFMEMEWYGGLRPDELTVESMKNVLNNEKK